MADRRRKRDDELIDPSQTLDQRIQDLGEERRLEGKRRKAKEDEEEAVCLRRIAEQVAQAQHHLNELSETLIELLAKKDARSSMHQDEEGLVDLDGVDDYEDEKEDAKEGEEENKLSVESLLKLHETEKGKEKEEEGEEEEDELEDGYTLDNEDYEEMKRAEERKNNAAEKGKGKEEAGEGGGEELEDGYALDNDHTAAECSRARKTNEKNHEKWLRYKEIFSLYYSDNGNLKIPGSYEHEGIKIGKILSQIRHKGYFVKDNPQRRQWLLERGVSFAYDSEK